MKMPLVGVSARNLKSELARVAWVEFDIVHKDFLSRGSRGRQTNDLMTMQLWMNGAPVRPHCKRRASGVLS